MYSKPIFHFFNGLTFFPACRCVAKDKVIGGVEWLLEVPSPVAIDQFDWRRLVPKLQHIVIVLGLKQKRKFHLGTLGLHGALHLLGWIPDRHIPSATIRQASRWRGTKVKQTGLRTL